MKSIAILSLKGGVGKTTTALYLATVAAHQGRTVTVLDVDSEHSACRWAQHLLLPFAVVEGQPERLARQVRAYTEADELVIIDTPPNSRELLMRAGSLVDLAIVPVAPSGLEVDRLRPTLELLADLQAQRPQLDTAILLTRYQERRILAHEAQSALSGLPVLAHQIREREAYKSAFGGLPAPLGEYQAVWEELQ